MDTKNLTKHDIEFYNMILKININEKHKNNENVIHTGGKITIIPYKDINVKGGGIKKIKIY